jgi:hypothetical protein
VAQQLVKSRMQKQIAKHFALIKQEFDQLLFIVAVIRNTKLFFGFLLLKEASTNSCNFIGTQRTR